MPPHEELKDRLPHWACVWEMEVLLCAQVTDGEVDCVFSCLDAEQEPVALLDDREYSISLLPDRQKEDSDRTLLLEKTLMKMLQWEHTSKSEQELDNDLDSPFVRFLATAIQNDYKPFGAHKDELVKLVVLRGSALLAAHHKQIAAMAKGHPKYDTVKSICSVVNSGHLMDVLREYNRALHPLYLHLSLADHAHPTKKLRTWLGMFSGTCFRPGEIRGRTFAFFSLHATNPSITFKNLQMKEF